MDTRGLGARHYNTLRRLGITTVEALARQDPASLHARWAAEGGPRAPTLPQVRVWVRAARAASR
jgi:predicted RecB family nuclease